MSSCLEAYFARLGLDRGQLRPDAATLARVHRAHALTIPYENLDVQLGCPVVTAVEASLAKIARGRGGWCYEMNGSLGAALAEIGFAVTRIAGGVYRATLGDAMLGNHLLLAVAIAGESYLCDVGFGDGLIEPVALREGPHTQGFLGFGLERLSDGFWRFHNDAGSAVPSFDFAEAPADEDLLARQCTALQTAPESVFVQNAVVQRHRPDAHLALVGRVLRRRSAAGTADRVLESADEYVAILASEFDLDLPEAADLWPRIRARHEVVFSM